MQALERTIGRVVNYLGNLLHPRSVARQAVENYLVDRVSLSKDQWHDHYWESLGVPRVLSEFVYEKFPMYSGVDFSKVIPTDRLAEDLRFSEVCWSDWDFDCFEDFERVFHKRINKFDKSFNVETIRDVMLFLSEQLREQDRDSK